MAITVSATKPRPVPGRLNLAYTYWRQRSAYVRLIKWIKLLCTRDRSVNVEVHEMTQMRVGRCARPIRESGLCRVNSDVDMIR